MADSNFNSEDRRAEMKGMHQRLEEGDARMQRIEESIAEILDIVQAAKGFFKVLGIIGAAVKWLIGIGTTLAAFYAVIIHPPKH